MLVSDPENLAKVRSSARILILLDKIVFSLAYELVEIINDVKLEFKFQVQDVRETRDKLGKATAIVAQIRAPEPERDLMLLQTAIHEGRSVNLTIPLPVMKMHLLWLAKEVLIE